MRKIFPKALASLVPVVFCSCTTLSYPALSKTKADNNDNYTIYYLFEHEGYKIYRFRDYRNEVYFSIPATHVTAIAADSTRSRVEMVPAQWPED